MDSSRLGALSPYLISGFGVVLFLIAVVHHAAELYTLNGWVGPLVAVLLDGFPALVLVYVGYWLAGTNLSSKGRWRVCIWCLVGATLFVAVVGLFLLVRAFEGRVIGEALFPLLIAAEAGGIAGAIAGYYTGRARVEARRAETMTNALEVVNSLIRHDLRNDLSVIPWDIETTGFAWDEHVTVAGFWYPAGHADLLVNTAEDAIDTDACERQLRDASGGVPVTVTATDDERGLLDAMCCTLFERFDREYNRLVAFNAEAWKGGFDLSFLRTRCARHGLEWGFDDLQFADLWDAVCKRLNTTHTAHGKSVEVNTLTGAHDLLCADAAAAASPDACPPYQQARYDPFDDSESAVTHYRRGEYRPVLQHNLADIHRTWELGELVRTYVAGSDVSTKTL